MAVVPNTDIYLLSGVPIRSNYIDTLWFSTPEEQYNYFSTKVWSRHTKVSYQRHGRNYITLKDKAGGIDVCNYLMFKNTGYDNMWFYAFILSIDYVNDDTVRIHYKIDVMQTYFIQTGNLGDCFVEREHSATDKVGDNLVKENLYFGEYMYGEGVSVPKKNSPKYGKVTMANLSVVIAVSRSGFLDLINKIPAANDFFIDPNFFGSAYQGVYFVAIPAIEHNIEVLANIFLWLDAYTPGSDVICSFMFPTMFLPEDGKAQMEGELIEFPIPVVDGFFGSKVSGVTYKPKNNKLLTYPYICVELTSYNGNSNDVELERFDRNGKFGIVCPLCLNPRAMAYPINYKNTVHFIQGAVYNGGYPVNTWSTDGVVDWLSNNLFGIAASAGAMAMGGAGAGAAVAGTVASSASTTALTTTTTAVAKFDAQTAFAGLGAYTNSPFGSPGQGDDSVGTINGAFSAPSFAELAIGAASHAFDPATVHGCISGNTTMSIYEGRTIVARIKKITPEYAKVIDDYFSRYGYATNTVKTPSLTSRKEWNYIKTKTCFIKGTMAGGDNVAQEVASIFNNGITFWHDPKHVGEYNLDNPPVNGGA